MSISIPAIRTMAAAALVVALAGLSGCGGGKTTAKGKVTYNGKPVVWGTVTLIDSAGIPHSENINLDGTFSINDVPSGPVKIGVVSPKPQEPRGGGARGAGAPDPNDPREKFAKQQGITQDPPRQLPPAGAWFAIPDKFADPNTSGLTGTVKSGSEIAVELKG